MTGIRQDSHGDRMRPRRVGMTPEIYLMLGAKPEDVGTAINDFEPHSSRRY